MGLFDSFNSSRHTSTQPAGGVLTANAIREAVQHDIIKTDAETPIYTDTGMVLHVGKRLATYHAIDYIDTAISTEAIMREKLTELAIPESGIILRPGNIYIIDTQESISSDRHLITVDILPIFRNLGVFGSTNHARNFVGKATIPLTVEYPTKIYSGLALLLARFYTIVRE